MPHFTTYSQLKSQPHQTVCSGVAQIHPLGGSQRIPLPPCPSPQSNQHRVQGAETDAWGIGFSPKRARVQHELIWWDAEQAGAWFPRPQLLPGCRSLWQPLTADSLGRQAAQIPKLLSHGAVKAHLSLSILCINKEKKNLTSSCGAKQSQGLLSGTFEVIPKGGSLGERFPFT